MSSTLFEAPPYDPHRETRRRLMVIGGIVLVVILGIFAYRMRYWQEERIAGHFFQALQDKQYETAYGIWFHDPTWQQHPQTHAQYPYNEFYIDWGPGGEWGLVKNFHVLGADHPRGGSGVVVVVEVNGRNDKARLWVENKDKTLTFSPM